MNFWLILPTWFQLGFLFVLGAVVGGQVNRGIYRLAWFPRWIGPWSSPHPEVATRCWSDRIPIFGWLGARREAPIHGAGFWVRPLLIELGMGLAFAGIYVWEMDRGLLPVWSRDPLFIYPAETILSQYLVQIVLLSLMMVATFIDFDEKTIPDTITLPGTLLMLLFATLLPTAALPVVHMNPAPLLGGAIEPLLFTTPNLWPVWLDGPRGLLLGCGCFVGWCYALVPKLWTTRRGWSKAVQYLIASIFRSAWWWQLSILAVVGCVAITGAWWWLGGIWWKSLLTALVGMAFGGGMIWSVRIVGSAVLDKEAMGFGDVTLMAMIGAYVGWQSSLMVFFMAPFAALIISSVQWLLTRRRDIAFGPYLCVATVVLVGKWSELWDGWAAVIFKMGLFIPGVGVICLAAMGILLMLWRFIEERIFRRGE